LPFHLEHNLSCKLLNTLPLAISNTNEYFDIMVFKGKTIVYLKGQLNELNLENRIWADFLIVGNNSIRDLNILMKNFDVGQIIIDGANSRWLASRLYQQSRELNINCISLLDQGGHLIKL
jgi:6-phosphogluconate dehydrogenase (decarboxylating)